MSTLAIQRINEAYEKKSTFLDLGNCALREIPKEILKLKDFLQHLNLGGWYEVNHEYIESANNLGENSLSDNKHLFNILFELKNLTHISLYYSNVGDEGANYISRLSSLTYLNLNSNNIGDKGAEYISKLSFLTSLNLGNNNIGDKGAEYVSKLSSLTSLNLESNGIGDKGVEYISRLSSLNYLAFNYNNAGTKGAEHISQLSSLTSLHLADSNIGDKGAEYISKLSSLTSLSLNSNNIEDNGAECIGKLSSLISLNLNYNEIGDKGAKHISKLSSLISLNLNYNKIGDKGAEHICKLSSLTSLSLDFSDIGDKGAKYIGRLSSLTYLDLDFNDIGDKGAEYISKLSSLTFLRIGNHIGNKGAEYISKLSSLTSLSLNGNIGDKGAEHISKLSSLTNLSLDNNIGDLGAEHISKLSLLTDLSLTGNIGDKGAEYLSKLSSLTSLSLYNNSNNSNLGDKGALYISKLLQLTSLTLNGNKLSDEGAQYISRLSRLNSLSLDSNDIGDKGARYISRLHSLKYLSLKSNNISNKGAEYINQISSLSFLDLINNKISEFYPNVSNSINTLRLQNNLIDTISLDFVKNIELEIDTEDERTYHLDKIFLYGNPITTPPPEVIHKGRNAIIEYLEGNLRPLNECKLIFIGDGSVGKTSLMKRLVAGEFSKDEKTTHGINKIAWEGLKNENGEPIKVNLWDFGGQHIQHSLHQFFFTERVVYVLVLNPRNDEKAGYWLDQIDKLGRNSKIIIVYNWKDEEDKQADFLRNFRELKKTYKYLPDPILLSCATGEGMSDFEATVKSVVLANESLRTKYPETWFNIKEKLETRIPIEKHYIEYSQYEAWCTEEQYNDPERRRNLLRILDSVGSIVFFDKPVLNQLQVLNPEWISTGAYAIITSEITRKKRGHLTWNDLHTIFSTEKEIFSNKNIRIKYEEPQFNFILQLMLDYRLCQKNPLTEHEYLIPSAFGEKPEKEYDVAGGRHYQLKFQSPFEMLIIHRFIAKNILNIISNDYWNSGIYFKHVSSNTYALVDTNQYSQVINCWIKGENIRGMWEVIRNDFREIFNMYHNFPVDEEVEYTAAGRIVFLKYEEMIGALNNGVTVIPYDTKTGLKDINVHYVLELFESPEQTQRNMGNEQIKVEVNPQITINPQFTNNPAISINHTEPKQAKDEPKTPIYNWQAEDLMVKGWKNKALKTSIFSFIITTLLVVAWINKWILKANTWAQLENHDAIKWTGIILGLVWNGFIIKSLYDRFLDPSKEKAYRESLRK